HLNGDFKNGLGVSLGNLGSAHLSRGNVDSALMFFNQFNYLGKQLHEAYPANVEYKNNLAISYVKLASIYLQYPPDSGLHYLFLAEKHFEELRILSPQNIQYRQYHEIVTNVILKLENAVITDLNQKIRQASDTSEIYRLYQTLCDTLRSKKDKGVAYKTQLSKALNSKAWYGFFLQRFAQNEVDIREAMALTVENKYLATNLAPALLLQGKFKEAEREYLNYKDQAFGEQKLATYKDAFLDDLKAFEKAGIIPEKRMRDVAKIRRLLER
ncbi:MAG: hypothetical protein AAF696_34315, partial [Bacteroidota bacterium]